MFYLVRSPRWLRRFFPGRIWDLPAKEKVIYLSLDDGPEPEVTSFVLDELARFGAKATFFCIGKNCVAHPELYERIIKDGHGVGNHSFDHVNGWKTKDEAYIENILQAQQHISSPLFRPPYGKLRNRQLRKLSQHGFTTVMWSVLSGDFDQKISPQKCLDNVINNAENGAIVVFHDSRKANEKMRYALPLVLAHFQQEGYRFDKISIG